ncbi:hypothetical protein ACFL6U_14485 [Planctomycetota bacterium]
MSLDYDSEFDRKVAHMIGFDWRRMRLWMPAEDLIDKDLMI